MKLAARGRRCNCNLVQGSRAHGTAASTPDPRASLGRRWASGVKVLGQEPSVRGAAAQGRGAQAAAMANHVRRLKLYPEPQTGGRRGGAEPGRGRRSFPTGHASILTTGQSQQRGVVSKPRPLSP